MSCLRSSVLARRTTASSARSIIRLETNHSGILNFCAACSDGGSGAASRRLLASFAERIIAPPLPKSSDGMQPRVLSSNVTISRQCSLKFPPLRRGRRAMNSSVVERSWVSVEDAFWKGLREIIAKRREEPLSDRQFANLSSAIRLFALGFYRTSPPFGGDIRRSRAA